MFFNSASLNAAIFSNSTPKTVTIALPSEFVEVTNPSDLDAGERSLLD